MLPFPCGQHAYSYMLSLGKLHKVMSISFEKSSQVVNRVVMEQEWKWSTPKILAFFG